MFLSSFRFVPWSQDESSTDSDTDPGYVSTDNQIARQPGSVEFFSNASNMILRDVSVIGSVNVQNDRSDNSKFYL